MVLIDDPVPMSRRMVADDRDRGPLQFKRIRIMVKRLQYTYYSGSVNLAAWQTNVVVNIVTNLAFQPTQGIAASSERTGRCLRICRYRFVNSSFWSTLDN